MNNFWCPGCSSRTQHHLLENGWWECEACGYIVSPEFAQTFIEVESLELGEHIENLLKQAGLVMRKHERI